MSLILPNNIGVVYPNNAFIYLNSFQNLQLSISSSTVNPGIYDIAYYLSSFNFVATTTGPTICPRGGQVAKTPAVIATEIQIMQLALSFNPNMNFYIFIDGTQYIDETGLQSQIQSDILAISNAYNSGQSVISGIYVDGFDFQANVGAGGNPSTVNPITKQNYSGLTFRNVQNLFQIGSSANGLTLAMSCTTPSGSVPPTPYSSGNMWLTNLPFVLSTAYTGAPANPLIFFQNQTVLIDKSLYGAGFSVSSSNISAYSATGYSSTQDFMNNLMILNSIYSSNFNYGLQVMLCVTANSVASYTSLGFFTAGSSTSAPSGIAETVFLLACWLGLDYICTAAYEDFYKSESNTATPPTLLVHQIFPFTNQYDDSSTYLYTPKGRLVVENQNTIGYKNNLYNEKCGLISIHSISFERIL